MDECIVGKTVYYGYFDDPLEFDPSKRVREGVVVKDDDDEYEVVIADERKREFVAVPKYCCDKVETVSSLDYPDSYSSDRYLCYGLSREKVAFQLSFKALSIVEEEYMKAKKVVEELEVAKERLSKEIGVTNG